MDEDLSELKDLVLMIENSKKTKEVMEWLK
jgi:hypothetical protein